MDQGGVGRVLVASLHQGISDLMPTRLEFYENWLHPKGLRDGKIGLAPLAAVLSFLRQEGEPYSLVTQRAGEYAAEWTFADLNGIEQAVIRGMPMTLRARVALQIAKRVIRRSYRSSRAITRLRRGEGTLTVRGSIFCVVREPFNRPLCVYYSAALSRLLTLLEVEGEVRVHTCCGTGQQACVILMKIPSMMIPSRMIPSKMIPSRQK